MAFDPAAFQLLAQIDQNMRNHVHQLQAIQPHHINPQLQAQATRGHAIIVTFSGHGGAVQQYQGYGGVPQQQHVHQQQQHMQQQRQAQQQRQMQQQRQAQQQCGPSPNQIAQVNARLKHLDNIIIQKRIDVDAYTKTMPERIAGWGIGFLTGGLSKIAQIPYDVYCQVQKHGHLQELKKYEFLAADLYSAARRCNYPNHQLHQSRLKLKQTDYNQARNKIIEKAKETVKDYGTDALKNVLSGGEISEEFLEFLDFDIGDLLVDFLFDVITS